MKTRIATMLLLFAVASAIKAQGGEELWIKNGNRNIYGVLNIPKDGKKKHPIAIISHGFNGTHFYGKNYFEPLATLGYACYTFDFPCGSVNSKSDPNTMNMSVVDEQHDLEAIIKYFRHRKDIDKKNIVIIGESQGGFVSAMTAAKLPKHISKVILAFPALCIPDNWNKRYPTLESIPDTTRLWNVPMGKRFFQELRDINVFKEIGKYKGPVLIVQGDEDKVVSMDDSKKAIGIYPNAKLHVIKGAGHGFKEQELQEYFQQMKLFLNQTTNFLK